MLCPDNIIQIILTLLFRKYKYEKSRKYPDIRNMPQIPLQTEYAANSSARISVGNTRVILPERVPVTVSLFYTR